MITPLTEKLFVKDYQHPYYTVKDKTFYSKPLAVKYCKEVGWQFPSFNISLFDSKTSENINCSKTPERSENLTIA